METAVLVFCPLDIFFFCHPSLGSEGGKKIKLFLWPPVIKGRTLLTNLTNMSYIEQFEAELLVKLQSDAPASIVRWASEKIRSSYKNGAAAARRGATKTKTSENNIGTVKKAE